MPCILKQKLEWDFHCPASAFYPGGHGINQASCQVSCILKNKPRVGFHCPTSHFYPDGHCINLLIELNQPSTVCPVIEEAYSVQLYGTMHCGGLTNLGNKEQNIIIKRQKKSVLSYISRTIAKKRCTSLISNQKKVQST